MEEQNRASKTKSRKRWRPLSAFKDRLAENFFRMRHLFGSCLAARARRRPVINLHGAEDRLVNEMRTYSGLWTSAERTKMELRMSRVRRKTMQQLMKKRLGPWEP